jgi:hypothetical protein
MYSMKLSPARIVAASFAGIAMCSFASANNSAVTNPLTSWASTSRESAAADIGTQDGYTGSAASKILQFTAGIPQANGRTLPWWTDAFISPNTVEVIKGGPGNQLASTLASSSDNQVQRIAYVDQNSQVAVLLSFTGDLGSWVKEAMGQQSSGSVTILPDADPTTGLSFITVQGYHGLAYFGKTGTVNFLTMPVWNVTSTGLVVPTRDSAWLLSSTIAPTVLIRTHPLTTGGLALQAFVDAQGNPAMAYIDAHMLLHEARSHPAANARQWIWSDAIVGQPSLGCFDLCVSSTSTDRTLYYVDLHRNIHALKAAYSNGTWEDTIIGPSHFGNNGDIGPTRMSESVDTSGVVHLAYLQSDDSIGTLAQINGGWIPTIVARNIGSSPSAGISTLISGGCLHIFFHTLSGVFETLAVIDSSTASGTRTWSAPVPIP